MSIAVPLPVRRDDIRVKINDWEILRHPAPTTGSVSLGPKIHVGQRSHWPELEVSLSS